MPHLPLPSLLPSYLWIHFMLMTLTLKAFASSGLHSQHLGLTALYSFGIVDKGNKDVTHLSSSPLDATTKAPQLGLFNNGNVLSQVEMYF